MKWLLLLLLAGCTEPRVVGWVDQPLGIYPPSAAELNGAPILVIGLKERF